MQRNLLTMGGPTEVIRSLPPAVLLLFRSQAERLPVLPDTEFRLRTACYRYNGTFLLPPSQSHPADGIEVSRRLVAELPVPVEVQNATFPDYAAELLSSEEVLSCLQQAGYIMADRHLVPDCVGKDAAATATADIYAELMAAERRNPGILFDHLGRTTKEIIHWMVWYGRNAYATPMRRAQACQRGSRRAVHYVPYDEDRPPQTGAQDGLSSIEATLVLEVTHEEVCTRLAPLEQLPAKTRQILACVARRGTRRAEDWLGVSRAEVHAAIRDARTLLEAQDLVQQNLAALPTLTQQAIGLVAQKGLTHAVKKTGKSGDWVLAAIRDGRLLVAAQEALRVSEQGTTPPLSEEEEQVLRVLAAVGQRQAAQELGVARPYLSQLVDDVRLRLGLPRLEGRGRS